MGRTSVARLDRLATGDAVPGEEARRREHPRRGQAAALLERPQDVDRVEADVRPSTVAEAVVQIPQHFGTGLTEGLQLDLAPSRTSPPAARSRRRPKRGRESDDEAHEKNRVDVLARDVHELTDNARQPSARGLPTEWQGTAYWSSSQDVEGDSGHPLRLPWATASRRRQAGVAKAASGSRR
jgi:hypothetical protein